MVPLSENSIGQFPAMMLNKEKFKLIHFGKEDTLKLACTISSSAILEASKSVIELSWTTT